MKFAPHILSAFVVISIIAVAVFHAAEPAKATSSLPVASLDRAWFYVDNAEAPSFTIKLDKPADSQEPALNLSVKVYSMVCDKDCRFEEIEHRRGAGHSEIIPYGPFGTTQDGDALTQISGLLSGTMAHNWPSVAGGQKALMVARLSSPRNVTIADGHDSFRLPNIVSAFNRAVAEGEETDVVIRLWNPGDDPVSVSYQLVDETAVWNEDYHAKRGGTVTFEPGQRRVKMPLRATQNDLFNLDRTLRVALSSPGNAPNSILLKAQTGVITIENDDDAPTLTADLSRREEGNTIYFDYEFELSEPSYDPVIIEYQVRRTEVHSRYTSYYDRSPETIEIGPDQTSEKVTLDIHRASYEANHTVELKLLGVTNAEYNGTFGEYIYRKKDELPRLTVAKSTRADESAVYFDYEFQLSEPAEVAVVIKFAPALINSDPNINPHHQDTTTIKIGPGATSTVETLSSDKPTYDLGRLTGLQIISVSDAVYEGTLGEYIIPDKLDVTPPPKEPLPTLKVSPSWGLWNKSIEDSVYKQTFSLDKTSEEEVTFDIIHSVHRIVCDPNCHYRREGNNNPYFSLKTIQPGETSHVSNLTYGVIALRTGVRYANNPGMILLTEIEIDDGAVASPSSLPPIVTAPEITQTPEGGEVSYLTLEMTKTSQEPIGISYEFMDDSAVVDNHYVADRTGTVTFKPGAKTARIPYRVPQNDLYNGDTKFDVKLSFTDPGRAIFASRISSASRSYKPVETITVSVEIQDDETLPIITERTTPGPGYAARFTISHPSEKKAEVYRAYEFRNQVRNEKVSGDIRVTFPPGSTTPVDIRIDQSETSIGVTFTSTVLTDAVYRQEFKTGAVIYHPDPNSESGFTRVREKYYMEQLAEERGITVAVGDASVAEGQVAEFEITLSEPLREDIEITYIAGEVPNGVGVANLESARMGADFKRETRSVTIAAGATSTIAYVWTLEDDRHELDEQFMVEVVKMSGVEAKTTIDGFVTIADNDAPPTMYVKSMDIIERDGEMFIEMRLRLTHSSHAPFTRSVQLFSSKSEDGGEISNALVTFAPGETRHLLTVKFQNLNQ